MSGTACIQKHDDSRAQSAQFYLPFKTAAEWLAAAALLVVCAPMLLVLAAVVKVTSQGPAFYSQERLGQNGRRFRILKLRTMTHNCEALSGPVWARTNDPRVTPIGRFLRDTHLDELPQLWNVLRGEMSLIGPRPERPEIADGLARLLPSYSQRLRLRPGLTGLAQMRLPGDRDLAGVKRKLRRDLYYVRNVGAMLDLRITIETVLHLTSGAIRSIARLASGLPNPQFATPDACDQSLPPGLIGGGAAFDAEAAEPLAA